LSQLEHTGRVREVPAVVPCGDDVGDACHAISEFSGLVNNADAKAGLAAAAMAAIVAGVAQKGPAIKAAAATGTVTATVALVFLVLLGVALVATVASIGFALIPRTPRGTRGGRFSYPTVADDDWQFAAATRAQAADEAWSQARTLSRILCRKFTAVKFALYFLGASFLLFCGWTVASSLL
jgi:hypothetical protein